MSGEKDKGGRPPVIEFDDEKLAQIEALAACLNQSQIADYFGISDRTLRRRIADDPKVMAAYKRGRAQSIKNVSDSLLAFARAGNVTAAIFYLKTQAGWKETQRLETEQHVTIDQEQDATELVRSRIARIAERN